MMTAPRASLYTSFFEAPPAACVSVPFVDTFGTHPAHRGNDGAPNDTDRDSSNSDNNNGTGGNELGVADISGSGGVGGGSAGLTRSFLVTGTYTLNSETQERSGSLLLHEVLDGKGLPNNRNADGSALDGHLTSDVVSLDLLHEIPLPSGSVLDIRLLHSKSTAFPHGSVLAVASSTGHLFVYEVAISATSTASNPHLKPLARHSITDENTLLLSLAICSAHPLLVSATTSRSTIILFKFADDRFDKLRVITEIESAHTGLETWTSHFGFESQEKLKLYSGGDDASFAIWDVSQVASIPASGDDESDLENIDISLVLRNKKIHTAGVTAILPVLIRGKEYVITGSYDQFLRVYSTLSNRWLDGEIDLGGGVWRLEVIPSLPGAEQSQQTVHVLVSCMHTGCRVLEINFDPEAGKVGVSILGSMEEHESMNYASAWVKDRNDNMTFISTSFYDRRACCWRL